VLVLALAAAKLGVASGCSTSVGTRLAGRRGTTAVVVVVVVVVVYGSEGDETDAVVEFCAGAWSVLVIVA